MDTATTPLDLALTTSGLEADGQLVIREALSPFYAQAAEWQAKIATVTEPTVARASRLLLKKIRVEAGHKKDELKAALLVRTRAIDAAFKTIEATIAPMEATLDAIEKATERAEAERIAKLKADRDAQLLALEMSPTFFQTGQMPEEAFQGLLGQARAAAPVVTPGEAQRLVGKQSPSALYRWLAAKQIKHVSQGRYSRAQIERALADEAGVSYRRHQIGKRRAAA